MSDQPTQLKKKPKIVKEEKSKYLEPIPEQKSDFSFRSLEEVRKKLLDLSNRNPLLNFRYPKVGCVRLIDELPDQIFQVLSEKKDFKFIPVKEPTEADLIKYGYLKNGPEPLCEKIEIKEYPTIKEWAKLRYGLVTSFDLPEQTKKETAQTKHQDTDLQSLLYPPDLEARLRTLRKNSETSIQDSGTNILYLNLGFLEWYESNNSDIPHLAPLFTLPVQLEQSKLDKKIDVFSYKIKLKDDTIITNITLKEKLFNDFSLNLPDIEDDITPEAYFNLIKKSIITNQPKWKIKRHASLVKLNFRKQVMYEDLDPKKWPKEKSLDKHPNLKLFFGDANNDYGPETSGFEEEHNIDSIKGIHTQFPIVFDADSSQHSALIDAVKGGNLVIEGPPGTGKSQTIANLIAAELSNGKKILFVTDKMAALEVVKDRLDKKGIGELCLELHSHKTNKKEMLDDLMYRNNRLRNIPHPNEINTDIASYEKLKEQLNAYAKLINSQYEQTGESINKILNRATRLREEFNINPDELSIEGISGVEMTPMARNKLIKDAEILKDVFEQASEQAPDNKISNHYWYGINDSKIKEYESKSLIELLSNWTQKLIELNNLWKNLLSDLEFSVDSNYQINNIELLCSSIGILPEINGKESFSEIEYLKPYLVEFESFFKTFESIHRKLDELSKSFEQLSLNDPQVLNNLEKANKFFDQIGINTETKASELVHINSAIENSILLADQIEKHFETIKHNLPDIIKNHIQLTKEGLFEFEKTINLIQQLDFSIWKDKDVLYDNPDLDELLPIFSKELCWIKPLENELHKHFSLHKIPEREELLAAQTVIDNSGTFSWFSADWRKAKKLILSLSATPKPNKKTLFDLFPKLIEYSRGIKEIDKIHQSNPILGELYRGTDTPIEEICVPLRNWYKSIREEYGSKFGEMADYGSAIINLDRPSAEALVDYDKKYISSIRKNLLENISSITDKIVSYKPLNDEKKKLSGEESSLLKLNKILPGYIKFLSKVLKDSDTPLVKIYTCKNSMGEVHNLIEEWTQSGIYKKLVPEVFPFSIKAGEKDDEYLSAAKNTLEIFKIAYETPAMFSSLSSKKDSSRYLNLKNCYSGLNEIIDLEKQTKNEFIKAGNVYFSEWTEASQNKIEDLIQKNKLAIDKPLWLSTWVQYLEVKEKLSENGFGKILERLEEKKIDSNNLIELVELIIYHQLAEEIMSENDSVKDFNGMFQTSLIKQFKECDRRLLDLQCRKISYNCSLNKPPAGISSSIISKLTELNLLKHEQDLKRKRTTVRGLVNRAGNAIQSLKPCFMMSPMSVAQYLPPGKFEFDLVIMDEASQIRPADSLGSIARGKRFVCVGDPKQLPPTMFFTKLVNEDNQDEEDTSVIEISDSILDAVMSNYKKRRLRWHYRSRHESLIAFSNQEFYDSDLVIFPSPFQQNKKFGIKYTPVKGRLANSRNRLEAAIISRKAAQHMLEHPKESIGIVAMNSEQREEIEMQFEVIRKENKLFSDAYTNNQTTDEPLFIKNLENVQGDERDVIMISLTYGPEPGAVKTMQRFGPINYPGGWRRLNVLFTRAKNRMHIFSSMGSSDIIISGTSKRGVKSLKKFLEYCETGHLHQPKFTGKPPDSDFEIAVIKAMEDRGYECEPQLGVAGYFLDLAVKDPKKPGRFLIGIECDGATNHSAKSARDRDRLRQEVLEGLGWEIHRIWSTDWFKNPEAQLDPIIKRLENLIIKYSEEDLSEIEVKEEAYLSSDSNVKEQITFFEKEAIQSEIQFENSGSIEEPTLLAENKPDLLENESSSNDWDLIQKLERFNAEEINIKFPNTDPEQRLLRPKMIDELVKNRPTNRDEFLQMIPQYLRNSTFGQEFKIYIDSVFEIVSEFE